MQQIDENKLETDLEYRFRFLAEFIGFGAEDIAAIHGAVVQLAPQVPGIVDRTYEKLLSYDATARHFVPRQAGYSGPTPASLAELSLNSQQIRFRKEHLTRYLMQLLGHAYNARMITYLDMVGKIHTPRAGNPEIHVPLVQMNALMGLLSDVLTSTILELPIDPATMKKTLRAFQKLLWIQNDFITRQYAAPA